MCRLCQEIRRGWLVVAVLVALGAAGVSASSAAEKPKPFLGTVQHKVLGTWRDAYRGGGLTFSPDGRRCAHWKRAGISQAAVVDGVAGPPYADAVSSGFVFSADGKHVACVVKPQRDVTAVILDGKPGPAYPGIIPQSLQFHPGTGKPVYVAWNAKGYFVVVGDQVGKTQFRISEGRVVFSSDGKHVAYLREGKPDRAYTGTMSVLVRDGKETGKKYWLADGSQLAMSPDGKHVAFSAKIGNAFPFVLDGKPEGQWTAVAEIVFSPDSRRYAYGVRDGTDHRFVVDGKPGPTLRRRQKGSLRFSADSKHVVYAGQTAKGDGVFLDGRRLELPARAYGLRSPVFGPRSRRVAVVVNGSRNSGVYVFDTSAPPQPTAVLGKGSAPTGAAFDPEGKSMLWTTRKTIHWDDRLIGQYENVLGDRLGFAPDGTAWCIAVREGKIVRVTAKR